MARPNKTGLSYFPYDVDFFDDFKVRKLIRRQGGKAIAVYALLLCFIYKNGYYIGSDEELPFIIAEKLGYDEVYVREVINNLFALELLDEGMYKSHGILTSRGIQNRFAKVQEMIGRRKYEITEYSLQSKETPVLREETPVLREETPVLREETPVLRDFAVQIKEKEKENKNKPPLPPGGGSPPAKAGGGGRGVFSLFETFWEAYPRKVGKGAAKKKFNAAIKKTTLDAMFSALEAQKQSEQWQRDNGQYIPHPATWLNQERWDDETNASIANVNTVNEELKKYAEDYISACKNADDCAKRVVKQSAKDAGFNWETLSAEIVNRSNSNG